MKNWAGNKVTRSAFARRALLLVAWGLFASGATYGQSGDSSGGGGSCTVTRLRFRIATADDDLRGGKDNLNIIIYFASSQRQTASNVNKGQNWPNDSVNTVEIPLNRPVAPDEIQAFRLFHIPDGSFNINLPELATPAAPFAIAQAFQSPDNWNMNDLTVTALGNGIGGRIANYGFHRFSGSDPSLTVYTQIPANICGSGRPTGIADRLGRMNPGARNVQNVSGAGSKYGKEQLAPSTIQPAPRVGAQLQNNRLIKQALAHAVQIGPRASAPGGSGNYSTLIGLLRKQSAAAHALLLPAVHGGARPANGQSTTGNSAVSATASSPNGPMLNGPSGGNQTGTLLNPGATRSLNPQPYPPKGKQPTLGASQTMSAPGNSSGVTTAAGTPAGTTQNFNLAPAPSANPLTPTNGPTAHQAPGGRQPVFIGARVPMPTQICKAGIATVDGAANGVWFSPVAGQDGKFVIDGCGFGNIVGEVYLSGVQYDPAHARTIVQRLGVPNSPDRVYFQIPPSGWTDRQIVAQIDSNAGGLYDTNNVTLNVRTSSGQIYQSPGMNFLAARADQVLQPLVRTPQPGAPNACYGLTLAQCLIPGINLAVVNASLGPLNPEVESPTNGDWLSPAGQSIAVVRGVIYLSPSDRYSVSFPSGTDTYQFNFAPGFQFDPNNPVLLNHASMDATHCQSLGGMYSNSGNWSVNYTSASSFQVHWEEESCSPGSAQAKNNPGAIGTTSGFAGFSAYELQITVIGPRGVNPLGGGKVNGLAIKQLQPLQMLLPKN